MYTRMGSMEEGSRFFRNSITEKAFISKVARKMLLIFEFLLEIVDQSTHLYVHQKNVFLEL